MSLLEIRRDRKSQSGGGPTRPPRLWKLILGLIVVVYLIWFLG